MDGLNELRIIGNVTKDAELKTVDVNGVQTPRCQFSVAVNKTRGEKKTVTYFDVTAWREYATKIAPWVKKGRQVHVSGEVGLNQYISSGTMRSSLQIYNPTVILLGKKPEVETGTVVELDEDELPFG